jgi:hypothetical protein
MQDWQKKIRASGHGKAFDSQRRPLHLFDALVQAEEFSQWRKKINAHIHAKKMIFPTRYECIFHPSATTQYLDSVPNLFLCKLQPQLSIPSSFQNKKLPIPGSFRPWWQYCNQKRFCDHLEVFLETHWFERYFERSCLKVNWYSLARLISACYAITTSGALMQYITVHSHLIYA